MSLTLIESPRASYLAELIGALSRAERFWLVTAFASSAGIELLAPAIRMVLKRPAGQGRLVLAVDQRGFNAAKIFETLLALKREFGAKFALGLVPESHGLLHAKALLTEGPLGCDLLVGSANLTHSAFRQNHELGVIARAVDNDVQRSFKAFINNLAAKPLDDANAASFLQARGLLPARAAASARGASVSSSWAAVLGALGATTAEMAPLPESGAEDRVADWIGKGYLVGRGRRPSDALVIRLPLDNLEARGLLRPTQRRSLGAAARESKTLGYSIDLLPQANAEAVRREARRVALLLAKLSLNLPCFGLWMPATYWDLFISAREQLTRGSLLSPANIRASAQEQRQHLEDGGLELAIEQVTTNLQASQALEQDNLDKVRRALMESSKEALLRRPPEMIAEAIQFRTARQCWAPFERTEAPYRQLMVDVVQAIFSTTYRAGDWPTRFRSFPAKSLVHRIASKLGESSTPIGLNGGTAMTILESAATWESARPFAEAVAEFHRLIPPNMDFLPPLLDKVLAEDTGEEGEDTDL